MRHVKSMVKKKTICHLIFFLWPTILQIAHCTLSNSAKLKASLQALQSVDSFKASKKCRSYGSDQVFPQYFPKYTSEVAIQWEQS